MIIYSPTPKNALITVFLSYSGNERLSFSEKIKEKNHSVRDSIPGPRALKAAILATKLQWRSY